MPKIRLRLFCHDLVQFGKPAQDILITLDATTVDEIAQGIADRLGIPVIAQDRDFVIFYDNHTGICFGGWLKRKSLTEDCSFDQSHGIEEGDIVYLQRKRPGIVPVEWDS